MTKFIQTIALIKLKSNRSEKQGRANKRAQLFSATSTNKGNKLPGADGNQTITQLHLGGGDSWMKGCSRQTAYAQHGEIAVGCVGG